MSDSRTSDNAGSEGSHIDRRDFLRLGGLLGGGFAVSSILAACGAGSAPAAKPTAASAAASGGATAQPAAASATKLAKPEQGANGEPLIFPGWNYHPQGVEGNVPKFNPAYG